jgi:hypothetical protein
MLAVLVHMRGMMRCAVLGVSPVFAVFWHSVAAYTGAKAQGQNNRRDPVFHIYGF